MSAIFTGKTLDQLREGQPLCGPIIRRSTSTEICIWVALYVNSKLKGVIYDGDDKIGESGLENGVQLGENFYIHLIKISPIQERNDPKPNEPYHPGTEFAPYPLKTLLAYDIVKEDDDSILKYDIDQLKYQKNNKPTFTLQGEKENLRILSGSCRKPHGVGADAMVAIDEQIKQDGNKRPHALFLTGDQIYADDVPYCLIKYLTKIGEELIGVNKHIANGLLPGERQSFLTLTQDENRKKKKIEKKEGNHAGFTSTHAANHLMSFGEYAAMYLMAWSPIFWEKFKFARDDDINQEIQTLEMKRTMVFKESVVSVRRILANIPTYMIFDDHEITDDWFINEKWKQDVLGKPLGKRIISNGLAAYWAFQGWGNAPDHFSDKFIKTIRTHLNEVRNDPRKAVNLTEFDNLLAKGNGGNGDLDILEIIKSQSNWSFVAPTYPLSLFLDTRTTRGKVNSPLLIDGSVWKYIQQLVFIANNKKTSRKEPIIIVAPSPIWGIETIEWLQKAASLLGDKKIYSTDAESWRANPKSIKGFFDDFLGRIQPSVCIVISGDVHYGFLSKGKIRLKKKVIIPFIQITSSALKNETYNNPSEGYPTSKLALVLVEIITGIRKPKKHVKRFLEKVCFHIVCKYFESIFFETFINKSFKTPIIMLSNYVSLDIKKNGTEINTTFHTVEENNGNYGITSKRKVTIKPVNLKKLKI